MLQADVDKPRKGEQKLAIDEFGLYAARHDVKGGAMAPAYRPWRGDVVALLHSTREMP